MPPLYKGTNNNNTLLFTVVTKVVSFPQAAELENSTTTPDSNAAYPFKTGPDHELSEFLENNFFCQ